jgi:hypothetical protein
MLHPDNLLLATFLCLSRDDSGGVQGLLCGRGLVADCRHDYKGNLELSKWKWDLLEEDQRDRLKNFSAAIKNIHFVVIIVYSIIFMINKLPRAINLE